MAAKHMGFDFRQLQIQLSKGSPSSLYFVFGEEDYLVNESVKLLISHSIDEVAKDFNFDQLYAADTTASRVKDLVETFPMMCERRVVVLKQAHLLKESDWQVLLPLFQKPIDSCVFILVAEKVDKRKKSIKEVLKAAQVVELKKPYENQLPAWVQYIGQQRDMNLDLGMAQLVVQRVGTQLSDIDNELLKLSQYLGDKPLTVDILEKVISKSRVDNVFDLTDALGAQNKVRALNLMGNLLANGNNEIGILAMISRHIRVLYRLLEGQGQGLRGAQLAQFAGVPSFFVSKYQSQMRAWPKNKLVYAIECIHKIDLELKSSPLSKKTLLESFLLKLMG